MEQPVDLEKLIGELEVAVDRLRSLYEQYFMGFEKLEPTVPRKDVDRRIYVLRKEQIRNTALRFRFHMLLQRYNTYQTHWQRICREIENGTYKRHVLRAQQRFAEERRRRSSAPPPPSVSPPLPQPADAPPILGMPILPVGQPMTAAMAAELAELDAEFAPAVPRERPERAFKLDSEPPTPGRRAPVPPAPRPPGIPRAAPPAPLPRVAPAPALPATLPSLPARPAPPPPQPRPAPPPAPPSRPRAAPPAPPAPLPPPAPASKPGPSAAAGAPAPPPSRPRQPEAPPPAPTRDAGLPEARMRALYEQYVEVKRRQNESTAAITYEAVAKTLRDSQAKLREKHAGRSVDFEVAVKEGKTVLRPIVK